MKWRLKAHTSGNFTPLFERTLSVAFNENSQQASSKALTPFTLNNRRDYQSNVKLYKTNQFT
jgi:hypothetical protein